MTIVKKPVNPTPTIETLASSVPLAYGAYGMDLVLAPCRRPP